MSTISIVSTRSVKHWADSPKGSRTDLSATLFTVFGWLAGPGDAGGGWTHIVTVVKIWGYSFGVTIIVLLFCESHCRPRNQVGLPPDLVLNKITWLDNIGRSKRSTKNEKLENFLTDLQRLTIVHEGSNYRLQSAGSGAATPGEPETNDKAKVKKDDSKAAPKGKDQDQKGKGKADANKDDSALEGDKTMADDHGQGNSEAAQRDQDKKGDLPRDKDGRAAAQGGRAEEREDEQVHQGPMQVDRETPSSDNTYRDSVETQSQGQGQGQASRGYNNATAEYGQGASPNYGIGNGNGNGNGQQYGNGNGQQYGYGQQQQFVGYGQQQHGYGEAPFLGAQVGTTTVDGTSQGNPHSSQGEGMVQRAAQRF